MDSLEASLDAELAADDAEAPPCLAAEADDLLATELRLLEIDEAADMADAEALEAASLRERRVRVAYFPDWSSDSPRRHRLDARVRARARGEVLGRVAGLVEERRRCRRDRGVAALELLLGAELGAGASEDLNVRRRRDVLSSSSALRTSRTCDSFSSANSTPPCRVSRTMARRLSTRDWAWT